MRVAIYLITLMAISLAPSETINAVTPSRSVSTSRQFVVYGSDAHLRGGFCDLAERIKKDVLTLLQKTDDWRTPIVISARYSEANNPEIPPASLKISQTGFSLKIQVDLRVGAKLTAATIEREVLRAIFLEMIYRNEPNTPAGTPYVQPPEWLLEGTLALAGGRDSSRIADGLGPSAATGDVLPLGQLLEQQPELLESPLRARYRAYAAALVLTLTEMPEGRSRLSRYLRDLPRAGNDRLADLTAHFPALGASADQVQKTWTASVSRLTASDRYRLLACEETERQLAQILHVEVRDKDGRATTYTLEEFPRFVRLADSRSALRVLTEGLILLSGRANPVYQLIVAEYQEITALLGRSRTKKIPQRLAELRATREHITRRMSAIGDYMNWFEATQSRTTSGMFGAYLDAAELAGKQERHRRDPISIYLEVLEAQLQN